MVAIGGSALRSRAVLLLVLLAAAGMTYYYLGIFMPHTRATNVTRPVGRYSFGNDFYPLWLVSRNCTFQRVDPYTTEVTREIQTGIFGRVLSTSHPGDPPSYYRTFAYPAFVTLFGLPVAWLPFTAARIVVAIVMLILTATSVLLWAKATGASLNPALAVIYSALTLSSYQGLSAIYALQPGLIVGFLLAASVAALVRNNQRRAGFLLALSTVKPQTSVLLIFFLLLWGLADWRQRRRFVFSFLLTLAALISSAMLIWPTWIADWLRVLMDYPSYSRPPLLPDLFGDRVGGMLLVLVMIAMTWFVWSNRRSSPTSFPFALAVSLLLAATTITLLPEHGFYDQIVLLPAVMLSVSFRRAIWEQSFSSRCILALAAGTIFWPWVAAPAVILGQILGPRLEAALLYLPLRTAAPLPFVVIAILFLVWRVERREQLRWRKGAEVFRA